MPKKNVALKLEDEVYGQVALLAQLDSTPDTTVTIPDVIRRAVDAYLASQRDQLAQRANEVLADIDRRAAEERARIEAIVGKPEPGEQARPKSSGRREANAS